MRISAFTTQDPRFGAKKKVVTKESTPETSETPTGQQRPKANPIRSKHQKPFLPESGKPGAGSRQAAHTSKPPSERLSEIPGFDPSLLDFHGLDVDEAELSPEDAADLDKVMAQLESGKSVPLAPGMSLFAMKPGKKEHPVERALKKNAVHFSTISDVGLTLESDFAPRLATILNRTRLNNILLSLPEPEIRDALLKQLQDYLGPEATVMRIDMRTASPKPDTQIEMVDGNVYASQAVSQIADLGDTLAHYLKKVFSPDPKKPFVLYLDNLNSVDTMNLIQNGETSELRKKFPGCRIILPNTPPSKDEDGEQIQQKMKAQMMTSMLGHAHRQESSSKPWRQGDFEIVQIPALRPSEQASLVLKDPSFTWLLEHFGMKFQPETLEKLVTMLQREYKNPLSLDDIRLELDSFGSYFGTQHNNQPTNVTDNDLRAFLKEIVRKRNTHSDESGRNVMASLVSKSFETIPAGTIGITMDDVAGLDEAKNVIRTAFLQDDDKVLEARLRGQASDDQKPTCVLLSGPPGCGKTFLAKGIAGENKATFLNVSTARIVQGLVGSGPANVEMLEQAIENAPDDTVIVYLEEVDALGKRDDGRSRFHQTADEERDKTINMMLEMLDGTKSFNKKVIFIGSTNRPGKLDKALKDRFQFKTQVGRPDAASRQEILQREVRLKNLSLGSDINLESVAKKADGLSGRHIYTVIKQLDTAKRAKLVPPIRKQFANDDAYNAALTEVNALKTRLKTDDVAVREFMTISSAELDQFIDKIKKNVAAKQDKKKRIGFQG